MGWRLLPPDYLYKKYTVIDKKHQNWFSKSGFWDLESGNRISESQNGV